MKRYKPLLKEETNALSKLDKPELVDKIIEFFKQNPYPLDHEQFHKFAESLGYKEASDLEIYCFAIISCFVTGGNFNKSGKKEEDFSEQEKQWGLEVEQEHVDMKTDNPVVKRIGEYMKNRIRLDHNADNPSYYEQGKAGTLQLEELVKK
jgi:hypothetical protein